jgi:hypothetical protein
MYRSKLLTIVSGKAMLKKRTSLVSPRPIQPVLKRGYKMSSTDNTNQEQSQTPPTKRHGSGRPLSELQEFADRVAKEMVENPAVIARPRTMWSISRQHLRIAPRLEGRPACAEVFLGFA